MDINRIARKGGTQQCRALALVPKSDKRPPYNPAAAAFEEVTPE